MAEIEINNQTNEKELSHEDITKFSNFPISKVESLYFFKKHLKKINPKSDKINSILNSADKALIDECIDKITEPIKFPDFFASFKIKDKKQKK